MSSLHSPLPHLSPRDPSCLLYFISNSASLVLHTQIHTITHTQDNMHFKEAVPLIHNVDADESNKWLYCSVVYKYTSQGIECTLWWALKRWTWRGRSSHRGRDGAAESDRVPPLKHFHPFVQHTIVYSLKIAIMRFFFLKKQTKTTYSIYTYVCVCSMYTYIYVYVCAHVLYVYVYMYADSVCMYQVKIKWYKKIYMMKMIVMM